MARIIELINNVAQRGMAVIKEPRLCVCVCVCCDSVGLCVGVCGAGSPWVGGAVVQRRHKDSL